MNQVIADVLGNITTYPGSPRHSTQDLHTIFGISFPQDYLGLLDKIGVGAEGTINGDDITYIMFWGIDNLLLENEGYDIMDTHPGLIAFGKNASSFAYAFDTRVDPMPVIEISLMNPYYFEEIGKDFIDFLVRMGTKRGE